ncbi:putative disease resistance protein RGA4 [Panicum virgatum]|uniref:putative disease resistance protein RGA4 n=1 Tax=Panicum virgatum TaxID=38727 RepID=UPI0019D68CF4|nr:putative disease resistance protein RGA4 [Panicum virgatum]
MAPAGPLVFAGKSVASSVIKEVVTKAFKYLDGYFSAGSMEEMKNKIEERMPQIQAVLDVVSPDHIKDQSEALDRWFWKLSSTQHSSLRDAVEEAEDAIDELEYYELEKKAKDRKVSDWGSPFTKVKHKVVKSVKSVSVVDKTLKQFTHRDSLKRLKKAMESLDKASAGTTKFLEVVKCLKEATSSSPKQEELMNNDRQTGSISTVTKLFGRENEKKFIIEWLTKETSVEEDEIMISTNHIPILSLVGHGGMGKTTLVQSICEEGDVVKDFEIIWVTISTSFDATSVTRKILESVNRKTPKVGSLEPLQQLLKDNLKSRKFLLILDDVWEEEKRNEWEKLFAPMRTGKRGSKILLTTRMASVAYVVAKVMGVGIECLTLEGLEEDDNFELFNHHVFAGLDSHGYEHLKYTGERIAKKLGGCPLVAFKRSL